MSDEPRAEERPPSRWALAVAAAVVVAAVVVLGVYHDAIFGLLADRARLQAFIADFGPFAPVIAILLAALQVVVAPLPGQLVGVACGYLFGPVLGTVYAMIGLVLGTIVAMAIGRRLGRPWVERFVSPKGLAKWDKLARRHGLAFFFLVFLLPFAPDDLVCFAMGLSPLPFWPMMAVAAVGRFPGTMVGCFVGDNLGAIPVWAWVLIVAFGLAAMLLLFRYGSRLEAATVEIAEKVDERAHPKPDDR